MDVIFIRNMSICYVIDYTLKLRKLNKCYSAANNFGFVCFTDDDKFDTVLKDTFHKMEYRQT